MKPSRMSDSGREILPDVQEWSEVPPGCLIVVGSLSRMCMRPSRMSVSGQETLPDVRQSLPDIRKWLGVPPG